MRINGTLSAIIIAVLLSLLLYRQQKSIENNTRLQAAVTLSLETLVTNIREADGRQARASAAQHASLMARLEEIKSAQPTVVTKPFEGRLAMKIICNSGEQFELTNAHLISNGKASESLSLRADSLAFWLQIPWERIRKVTVRKSGTDTRPLGVVTLQDGTIHEHLIHSSEICGITALGQIQIAIPDVREMVNVTEPGSR